MDLKKLLPENGPPIKEVSKYIEKYKNELIVIKYGGNVFIDRNIFDNFIADICLLNKLGLSIVVVHGGGPRIKRELDKSNIQSNFIRGLRVTDKRIIDIVERVLIDFNNDIVSSLEKIGSKAVSVKKKKKQGYKDRKDESIAMRIKKKRTKKQLKASRDESYGKFGSKAKKSGKINK